MAGRLLLGIVAALRAGLIPGQAQLLMSQQLTAPQPRAAAAEAVVERRGLAA